MGSFRRRDLEDELARHLPADRREAWGPADLSSNPFEQITRQLSVLYHEIPAVTNLNGDISDLTSRRTCNEGRIMATDAKSSTDGNWTSRECY